MQIKKTLLTLLTIFILVPIIGTFDRQEVKALGQNEMSCGAFEVDYINDDGSFTLVSCYDDLNSAKAKMKENTDYVVRHAKSLSYTKIVAMNSGIAYSYPRFTSTISIYQNLNDTSKYYKSTYVSRHYELNYLDTSLVGVGKNNYAYGMIEVNIMGFHGYCDLENVDLVPSKYIRNGISITLGGNNTYTGENFFSIVPKQNYFECVDNNGVKELQFHMYYGYGTNGQPESYAFTIGLASEAMQAGSIYYSYDGYNFYPNADFTGTCITYYNYYQFLPLRSKSTISADALNSYIAKYSGSAMANSGQYFIDAQNTYGINALLLFAMACHESGNGTSYYAKNRNNLFGWNAYDSDPNQASSFTSIKDCVNEQAGINLRGFVDITDGRFFSTSLGNKGSGLNVKYASDPYWGMKIASIAYSIDKNYNSFKDNDVYTLSLINTFDVEVKALASDSSKTLYTTQYGPYYQENFIVIVLGTEGEYTKIQSTNPIDDNSNIKTHRTPITTGNLNDISSGIYDFDKSVGYIKTSYLTKLNSGSSKTNDVPSVNPSVDETKKARSLIDSLALADGYLNITGCAYIKGLDFSNKDNISFTINIKNVSDDSIYKSYSSEVKAYEGINFNDGLNYTYTGFSASISLSDLINDKDYDGGVYYLSIEVKNGSTILSSTLTSSSASYSNLNYGGNGYNYRITTNSRYTRRIELDVESIPSVINYNEIIKPSNLKSLFAYDTLNIDENGLLTIDGQCIIYYTNYDNAEQIKYTLYLVNDSDNYFEIPLTVKKSPVDYKSLLKSSYNMDYICFEGSTNLTSLKANIKTGYYSMILKVQNGSNVDYVELSTTADFNVTNGNYRIFKSTIRNRLMLQIGQEE